MIKRTPDYDLFLQKKISYGIYFIFVIVKQFIFNFK